MILLKRITIIIKNNKNAPIWADRRYLTALCSARMGAFYFKTAQLLCLPLILILVIPLSAYEDGRTLLIFLKMILQILDGFVDLSHISVRQFNTASLADVCKRRVD